MSDRPPLHPIALEQLERAAKKIDADYWHALKALQVDYRGPKTLSPPKTPQLLLNRLQMYAGALFRLEEPNYPKGASSYGIWIVALGERVTARVLSAFAEVEESEGDAKLAYHGLSIEAAREGLHTMVAVLAFEYAGIPIPKEPVADKKARTQPVSRRELADAYKAQFPGAKLADIAYAAHQTYREWKRWLSGEAKDGLTADLAFRKVLTSGKPPSELRPGSRFKTRG